MEKVFLYARRSNTKGQDVSISIEKQIEEMTFECALKGYEIIRIFSDNKSGYTAWKRDDFTRMIDEIRERNIRWRGERVDAVMVFMASRLCRNRAEAREIEEMLESEVVHFLSKKEGYGNDLASKRRFIDDINEAIYESKYKAVDAKKNMDQAAKKGRLPRRPPYWYKVEGRWFSSRVVLDHDYDAAEVVLKTFELYSTGEYGYDTLATKLNELGYRRPKTVKVDDERKTVVMPRLFTLKDVEKILVKKFYWGKVEQTFKNLINDEREYFSKFYGDQMKTGAKSITIDYTDRIRECGTFTPIITRDLFEKCERIRNKKGRGESKAGLETDAEYAWKGILRCPCQHAEWTEHSELRSFTAETKVKKETWVAYRYYRCSNNIPLECGNAYMSERAIEKLVMSEIISKLRMTPDEASLFQSIITFDLERLKAEKKSVSAELEDALKKIRNDEDYYKERVAEERDADIREIARSKYEKARIEREEIENQIRVLPDVIEDDRQKIKERVGYIEEIGGNFPTYAPSKKKALLNAMFEYIVIYQKKVIKFRLKPFFENAYERKVLTGDLKSGNNVRTDKKEIPEPKNDLRSLDLLAGSATENRTPVCGMKTRRPDH